MRNIILFFLLLLNNIAFYSQKTTVSNDSLNAKLNLVYTNYDELDYLNAVIQGRQLLEKAYEKNDSVYIAEAYYALGIIDETVQDYNKAEEKYTNALNIAEARRDSVFLVDIYNGLANIASLQKKHKKSDALYHKALHISNVINDNTNNQDIILNICWNFLDENKYEKVTPYLNSLLSFQPKENQKDFSLGDYVFISDLNFVIGRYYGEIGEYKLAHEHFEKAISIAENNDLYEELNQAAKANAKYYQKEGDFESALSNTQKYIISKERLLDKNLLQKLQVEKAKYSVNEYERALEVSEKEKKLADSIASSKNKLSWLYLVVCVILAIFLVIIFLSNRKRKKLIKSLNHKNKQLVKAQKEAEEAADIKANFISNVSHELRTPLHGVIGITSLLLAEKDISKNNRKLLKSLKFSGDYLLGLINNVLLMSKIDNGKLQIKPYLIKVENLVSTIRSGIEFSAKKKEVEISFVIEPEVPEKVILDSNIVSEILINLIENAIKFSKGGKVITKIEVNNTYPITSEDLTLRFTVEDNGTGIPENKKEIIFNKFSQVALERNMLEGTGIGLSLVKSLLLHLGSDIKLETEMGVGSKFYFDLKCKLSEEVEIRPTIAKENLKFLYENKKILLVEDNEINMMVTKKFLSPYQIDLEIISDGKEAYEALLKNHYDLILLDINIPSMSGYEISKKIREKGIEVPIVAVTASELSEIEEKAYGLGMDDIIIKPFQKQKLIQTLSKFFND